MKRPKYCVNNDDSLTSCWDCSLRSYGKDCKCNPIQEDQGQDQDQGQWMDIGGYDFWVVDGKVIRSVLEGKTVWVYKVSGGIGQLSLDLVTPKVQEFVRGWRNNEYVLM